MPTTYKKILNQGTSNPIVARTTVQSITIIDSFPILKISKEKIFSINLNLCKRLLAMEDFTKWLSHECEVIKTNFLAHGLTKIGEEAFETPRIIDLDNRVEAYLQAAKLSISDCGQILGELVGMPFDHKYYKIIIRNNPN